MAHFTHRIRYRTLRPAIFTRGQGGYTSVEDSFRTTPDALGAELIRLTSDPNVTDVRIEALRENVR